MIVDIEKIKAIFKECKYYPTEELLWRTYINLQKVANLGNVGQEIYAICLEGPPGSGKSEYAKVYSKMLSKIFNENIEVFEKDLSEENKTEFLRYTCNPSTGKESLYEDIRIASAIVGKNDDVIIPGILIKAIRAVNEGKRVLLFLDEYDKAKLETDGFLLEFLQDGRLFTTQTGELVVNDPKKLQVIICKNDNRVELSGPLTRRLKFIRLEHMKPELMIQIINDKMPTADSNIKTLVMLLYNILYNSKDEFKKLSSCPEVMMAIEESEILKNANAPTKYIYNCIITNMIKSELDLYSFEKLLGKKQDLNKQILAFKEVFNKNSDDFNSNIYQAIYDAFFKGNIKETIPNIEISQSKPYVSQENDNTPSFLKEIDVNTSNDFICGNINVGESKSKFDSATKWYKVGSFEIPIPSISALIKMAQEVRYDGPILYEDDNYSLIAVKKVGENSTTQLIEFYASSLVMPTTALIKLKNATKLAAKNEKFEFNFLTITQFLNDKKQENGLVHVEENNKNTNIHDIFNSIGEVKFYTLMDKTIVFNSSNFIIQNFGKSDVATSIQNSGHKIHLERDSDATIEAISKLYNLPFKESAIACNRAYSLLTPTSDNYVKTINYQTKSSNIKLEVLDLNAIFESARIKNDQIVEKLNIEFLEKNKKTDMPQRVFRRMN